MVHFFLMNPISLRFGLSPRLVLVGYDSLEIFNRKGTRALWNAREFFNFTWHSFVPLRLSGELMRRVMSAVKENVPQKAGRFLLLFLNRWVTDTQLFQIGFVFRGVVIKFLHLFAIRAHDFFI